MAGRLELTRDQRKILIESGISRQLVHAWERGICLPGKKLALRVHELTGLPLLYILYGRDVEGDRD